MTLSERLAAARTGESEHDRRARLTRDAAARMHDTYHALQGDGAPCDSALHLSPFTRRALARELPPKAL